MVRVRENVAFDWRLKSRPPTLDPRPRSRLNRVMKSLLLYLFVALLMVGCGKAKAEFENSKRMAEMGNPYAQSALGMMYVLGHGVARDPILGHAWYSIAIANGQEEMKEHIKEIQLTPEQLIEAQKKYSEIVKRIEAKGKEPTDPGRLYKPSNP